MIQLHTQQEQRAMPGMTSMSEGGLAHGRMIGGLSPLMQTSVPVLVTLLMDMLVKWAWLNVDYMDSPHASSTSLEGVEDG